MDRTAFRILQFIWDATLVCGVSGRGRTAQLVPVWAVGEAKRLAIARR